LPASASPGPFLLLLFSGLEVVVILIVAISKRDPAAAFGVIWLLPLSLAIWTIAVLLHSTSAAEFNVPREL
jgi:hypothetical protein